MAETEESESVSDPELSFDSMALGLALDRSRSGRRKPGRDDAADRLLAAQEALIADQRHQLREQARTLGLDRWSKRLRLGLQALTILVGLLALASVGVLAWRAHNANGV